MLVLAAGSRHHSRQQKTSSGIVHQLFNKSNYVPDLLPLCSTTETVNVKIGMALRGILDVVRSTHHANLSAYLFIIELLFLYLSCINELINKLYYCLLNYLVLFIFVFVYLLNYVFAYL